MKTDSELKIEGFKVLSQYLGMVEAERFISLIQHEKFDYTKWRQDLFSNLNGREISKQAMDFQNSLK